MLNRHLRFNLPVANEINNDAQLPLLAGQEEGEQITLSEALADFRILVNDSVESVENKKVLKELYQTFSLLYEKINASNLLIDKKKEIQLVIVKLVTAYNHFLSNNVGEVNNLAIYRQQNTTILADIKHYSNELIAYIHSELTFGNQFKKIIVAPIATVLLMFVMLDILLIPLYYLGAEAKGGVKKDFVDVLKLTSIISGCTTGLISMCALKSIIVEMYQPFKDLRCAENVVKDVGAKISQFSLFAALPEDEKEAVPAEKVHAQLSPARK